MVLSGVAVGCVYPAGCLEGARDVRLGLLQQAPALRELREEVQGVAELRDVVRLEAPRPTASPGPLHSAS